MTGVQTCALPIYLLGTFGFTGELQDGASDLLYLRARWYDPGQSTFTSRDPFVGFPETPYSLHPYQYAYSNPVLWTDPSGRIAIVIPVGLVFIAGVVIIVAVDSGAVDSTRMANTGFSEAPEALKDYFEHTIPTAIDVVSQNAPRGWMVVQDNCSKALEHLVSLASGGEPQELQEGKNKHKQVEQE